MSSFIILSLIPLFTINIFQMLAIAQEYDNYEEDK